MLSQLSIKNVAVIDKLDVDINNGVTVLTGETGAGKSIIIDSINMILGERTNKDIVRYGTDRATVQAVFTNIPKILESSGSSLPTIGVPIIISSCEVYFESKI